MGLTFDNDSLLIAAEIKFVERLTRASANENPMLPMQMDPLYTENRLYYVLEIPPGLVVGGHCDTP
jgi:hypothetical protein